MDRDRTDQPPAAGTGAGAPAPGLYLVATPIGNARDITLRAMDVLAGADVVAAEDTRHTGRLLEILGIRRSGRLVPYHDHNGAAQRPRLLAALAEGRSVALVSDAGTPLVADPGYRLAAEAIAAGHAVTAVPGASAVLAALAVAGLPTDRFLFAGFLPPKSPARRRTLAELAAVPASLVLYESPRRLAASLADMAAVLGGARPAAVCRELTKRFEETRRGSLAELADAYAGGEPKGEIVVVVGPPPEQRAGREALDAALSEALETLSVKDAAAVVAAALGLPRREVYARALEMGR
jgi:16S rRNA (cytidine1402-2'-O)-methyltransferase